MGEGERASNPAFVLTRTARRTMPRKRKSLTAQEEIFSTKQNMPTPRSFTFCAFFRKME